MKLPSYYNPTDIERLYLTRKAIVQEEAINANLKPAADDKLRVALFMIDNQLDFILDALGIKGSLAIPGAMGDTTRIIEWIYKNMEVLTNIYASLDMHQAWQIFYSTWWVDKNGNHPAPFTPITYSDVIAGKFKPVRNVAESIEYVRMLEKHGKYVLTIWPHHTMLGDIGFAMPPALFEAVMFHSIARKSVTDFETKGIEPLSEHYSVLGLEVMRLGGKRLGKLNVEYINTLFQNNDLVYIQGQAKSHCKMSTIDMMLMYLLANDPDQIKKIRILINATSPVAPPPIDPLPDYLNFPVIADRRFKEYESDYGIPLVSTYDAIK